MSDSNLPDDVGKEPGRQILPISPTAVSSTTQNDNRVSGHMSGRDVNVYANSGDVYLTNPDYLRPIESKISVFRKLFEKLEREAAEDKTLTSYIRQLEVYTREVENEDVVGLGAKMLMASRDRQEQHAAALKENVYGALKANFFSPTYQLIVATLMSKVHERFHTEIRPLIEAGADNATIDKAVSTYITGPFSEELEACPQFEDVAVDYVRGMVFFLTGNCHIRWDKC